MATWSISPNSGATINSSGVFSASTNPMETSRSWTVTYTDNDNHTASTVITQEGCMACPTGVTVVPYQGYTIGTASGYDYKVTFDTSAMDSYGRCQFYVDAAYYDGEQGSVEDCTYAGINVTINSADECVYAEGGDDWIEEDDFSISVDCYQYGVKDYDYWQGKRLSLDITNKETNVTKKVLVEMRNPLDKVGVEFIFSGNGWNTLINSVRNGNSCSLGENSHDYSGRDVGLNLEAFPKYQFRPYGSDNDSCTSFYGHLPITFSCSGVGTSDGTIAVDTTSTGPMAYDKRIDILYPENKSIENTDWQNLYIRYLPSLTADTDTNIAMNYSSAPVMKLRYNYKEITLNQQGYKPTTNIPIPGWITPSNAFSVFWGGYGPSQGQGTIFAIMIKMPENPLTEKVKVLYYLQTEDD